MPKLDTHLSDLKLGQSQVNSLEKFHVDIQPGIPDELDINV